MTVTSIIISREDHVREQWQLSPEFSHFTDEVEHLSVFSSMGQNLLNETDETIDFITMKHKRSI
jgi:hypothetical protein